MNNHKSDDAIASVLIDKHKQALKEHDQIWDSLIRLFERSRVNYVSMRDLHAAGRVFGLDLAGLERNARLSAQEFFLGAKARKLREKNPESSIVDYSELIAEERGSPKVEPEEPPQTSPDPAMPRIRDVVLDRLRAAGTNGTRAAPIREYIKEKYGREVHEKTVGMTLYRLANDKFAHRIGITWFYGSAPAGTQNPGASTPGSQEDLLK